MGKFFVSRPIFAIVLSLIIMLAGVVSLNSLPQEQYPDISLPNIYISTMYRGASAETVENTVTKIIEKELTGLDGLLYFSSTSSSSGQVSISLTFDKDTDPDTAQTQVNNKVQQITASLPSEVQDYGVSVVKQVSSILMVVVAYDETNRTSNIDVADYLAGNIQDPLSRIDGVGSLMLMGSEYAMRIWLDPNLLRSYNLMPSDVEAAIRYQNIELAMGQIGAPPAAGLNLTATVTAISMMKTVEEFEQIIIKSDPVTGATVRLSDVAKVEIGSEIYAVKSMMNGHPAAGILVQLSTGANALQTSQNVRDFISNIEHTLPDGYHITYSNDNSEFVQISIKEVVYTLIEAIILVIIVMFAFLRNWRATIIPAITVPVVLLGTFAVLLMFGFTVNTLTLFALVLAIGLLVDDAIVVVENVERVMKETNLPAKEATIQSMKEVTSALIGIAVVIIVVFVPMAFFGGSTGVIYRQFSVTIITAMALSVFVAVTLTPALCGSLLKANHKEKKDGLFDKFLRKYENGVAGVLKRPVRFMLSYGLAIVVAVFMLGKIPTGFIPNEDQGIVLAQFTLPDGADLSRTEKIAEEIEAYFMEYEGKNIKDVFAVSGFSFAGLGQNSGIVMVSLKDWSERENKEDSVDSIVERAFGHLSTSVRDANVYVMSPPAIMGLGMTDGIELYIRAPDATLSRDELAILKDDFLQAAYKNNKLTAVRASDTKSAHQLHLNINTSKAMSLGLSMADVYNTLGTAWGSRNVNDFMKGDRSKSVFIQALPEYRSKPEDINLWTVRNHSGDMVPYSEFTTHEWVYGPELLERYNGLAAYKIQANAVPGISTGEAMNEVELMLEQFPQLDYSWSGISYQEKESSGQATKLYALAILVVFLCLAALYESWSIPISVLMVIPLGVLGAVLATYFRGLDNNIYFQVALLTVIGLAAKNAIMMVEFIESGLKEGKTLLKAAIDGASLRLRPIIMTSLAFLAGVMPLAMSSGVGANSRIAIGTGIVGGTFLSTLLSVFLVPLFFVLIKRLFRHKDNKAQQIEETENV